MRTDQDLHGAFALLEQSADAYGAPEITTQPAKPVRVRRERGHLRRNVLAVAVTAAVVGGGIYAATSMGSSGGEARPAGPPPVVGPTPPPVKLQFTFAVGPVAGVTVDYHGVYRRYQSADVVWDSDGGVYAGLDVYAPGGFDSKPVTTHGTKITVGTHVGYWDPTHHEAGEAVNGKDLLRPTLAWQYGRNSWATVEFQPTDVASPHLLDKAITLAKTVRTGVSSPLRLPFKIGYLPPDLVPELAYVLQSNPGSGRIGLSDGVRTDDPTLGGLSIEAMENIAGSETTCSKRVSVQGTTACFRNLHEYAEKPGSRVVGRELRFETPARMVTITIDRAHLAMYSDDDLVEIARSLTFAPSLADYSTWYDAGTVLPH